MNSVALLVTAAVLGVDYGWQPTADGQLEYIIQIEPVTLIALRGGQDLVSQLDPYVRQVRRFRIRVGTEIVPRRGTPHEQPPPAAGAPPPPGVAYGWQPVDSQQMEFIVQISPERLAAMRNGEDVAGEIPPLVQNVSRLRLRTGVGALPQQGLQTASATLPTPPAAAGGEARQIAAEVAAAGPLQPPAAALGPPASSPRVPSEAQVPSQPPGQPPSIAGPTPGSAQYAAPPEDPTATAGASAAADSPRQPSLYDSPADQPPSDRAAPHLPHLPPQGAPATTQSDPQGSWSTAPRYATNPQPDTNPVFGQANAGPPYSPPASQYPGLPPSQQVPPTAPVFAADRSPPSADGWTYSQPTAPPGWQGNYGQPPDTRTAENNSTPGYVPYRGGFPLPGMTGSRPVLPWEERLEGIERDRRATELAGEFWTSLAATARDPSLAFLHEDLEAGGSQRPWGTLTLALLVLFASLGANLYMGWIATDMYRRYLGLADDLIEDDPRPRSRSDDDLLDEEEQPAPVRRRRQRTSLAA